MDDLIDRQAVIDELEQLWDMSTVDGITASTVLKQIKTDIRNLPSAQPDKNMIHLQKEQAYMQGWEDGREALRNMPSAQPEIIRCKDCYLRYTSCPMVVRIGNILEFFTQDDDFCSRAQRKGAEKNGQL